MNEHEKKLKKKALNLADHVSKLINSDTTIPTPQIAYPKQHILEELIKELMRRV